MKTQTRSLYKCLKFKYAGLIFLSCFGLLAFSLSDLKQTAHKPVSTRHEAEFAPKKANLSTKNQKQATNNLSLKKLLKDNVVGQAFKKEPEKARGVILTFHSQPTQKVFQQVLQTGQNEGFNLKTKVNNKILLLGWSKGGLKSKKKALRAC